MILLQNVKRLEHYLRRTLIGSRRPSPVSTSALYMKETPLYHGSRVPARPRQTGKAGTSSRISTTSSTAKRPFSGPSDVHGDPYPKRRELADSRNNVSSAESRLNDHDIPDNLVDFGMLAARDLAGVFRWSQSVKVRLAQPGRQRQ